MKIALLGAGTVGSGVVEVLRKNFHEISQKANCEIEISKILVRNLNRPRQNLDGIELVDRFEKILDDPEIKIVVEVMGGIHPALDYMLASMKHGKSVVTANKDAIAEHGKDLFAKISSRFSIRGISWRWNSNNHASQRMFDSESNH